MKGHNFPVYLCTSCCKDLLWCLTFTSLTSLVLKILVFNNSCGPLQSLEVHRRVKLLSLCIVGCCNNGLNFSNTTCETQSVRRNEQRNRGNRQSECDHPPGEWIYCCMNGWFYMCMRFIMACRIHRHANSWSTLADVSFARRTKYSCIVLYCTNDIVIKNQGLGELSIKLGVLLNVKLQLTYLKIFRSSFYVVGLMLTSFRLHSLCIFIW